MADGCSRYAPDRYNPILASIGRDHEPRFLCVRLDLRAGEPGERLILVEISTWHIVRGTGAKKRRGTVGSGSGA